VIQRTKHGKQIAMSEINWLFVRTKLDSKASRKYTYTYLGGYQTIVS